MYVAKSYGEDIIRMRIVTGKAEGKFKILSKYNNSVVYTVYIRMPLKNGTFMFSFLMGLTIEKISLRLNRV
jgi:hypothetical protein